MNYSIDERRKAIIRILERPLDNNLRKAVIKAINQPLGAGQVIPLVWEKLDTWSIADRKIILDRVVAATPTHDSLEACINRTVSEFLRKRGEKKGTVRIKGAKKNPVLQGFMEKYSPLSEDPDIQFVTIGGEVNVVFHGVTAKIWEDIYKRIPDRPYCERMDIMLSALEAFSLAADAGKIRATSRAEVGAWLRMVVINMINARFRGLDRERKNLAWKAISSTIGDASEDDDQDEWLEYIDVSRGSQSSDSFEYGQHPEADLDEEEFNLETWETLGGFQAGLFWAYRRGATVKDLLRLLNAWALYRAANLDSIKDRLGELKDILNERDLDGGELRLLNTIKEAIDNYTTAPAPAILTRNAIKKALETARNKVGKSVPKRTYRSRKNIRGKRARISPIRKKLGPK